MDEHDVINVFVTHLGHHKGYPNLAVSRWPDKENRTEPEIDAVAGVFAIEHTSIDSVANQRQLDDWYSRVVGGLDQVIQDCVDCVMRVRKGLAPSIVGFARLEPEDDTLPARIRKILDRKTMKLRKYQGPFATTILLVENDDIALMNEFKMLDGIREAYADGLPQGVDEIWFADTSIPDKPQFHDFTTKIVNECHRPSSPQ